jgi:hypothetical protein
VELHRNGSLVWFDRRNGTQQGVVAFGRPRRLGKPTLPPPLSPAAARLGAKKLVCGAEEAKKGGGGGGKGGGGGTDLTLRVVPFAAADGGGTAEAAAGFGTAAPVAATAGPSEQMSVRAETAAGRDDWLLALRCLCTVDDTVGRPGAPAGTGGAAAGVTSLMLAAGGGLRGDATVSDMLFELQVLAAY